MRGRTEFSVTRISMRVCSWAEGDEGAQGLWLDYLGFRTASNRPGQSWRRLTQRGEPRRLRP